MQSHANFGAFLMMHMNCDDVSSTFPSLGSILVKFLFACMITYRLMGMLSMCEYPYLTSKRHPKRQTNSLRLHKGVTSRQQSIAGYSTEDINSFLESLKAHNNAALCYNFTSSIKNLLYLKNYFVGKLMMKLSTFFK